MLYIYILRPIYFPYKCELERHGSCNYREYVVHDVNIEQFQIQLTVISLA